MIDYSPIINQIVFKGHHPLTGVDIEVIFNEQNQLHKQLLMWNRLLGAWMLSCDAGLTWKNLGEMDILYPHVFANIIETSDLILNWRPEVLELNYV